MQQILSAHGIPSRVVGQGIGTAYLGNGSPCVLQVHRPEQWTALLLLSPTEDEDGDEDEDNGDIAAP